MLTQIKLLLGLQNTSDQDALLTLLLNRAIDECLAFTHNEDCICHLESTIVSMVVINYNRLSTESLKSESYSGISLNYENDYPEPIMRALKAYRKVRTI